MTDLMGTLRKHFTSNNNNRYTVGIPDIVPKNDNNNVDYLTSFNDENASSDNKNQVYGNMIQVSNIKNTDDLSPQNGYKNLAYKYGTVKQTKNSLLSAFKLTGYNAAPKRIQSAKNNLTKTNSNPPKSSLIPSNNCNGQIVSQMNQINRTNDVNNDFYNRNIRTTGGNELVSFHGSNPGQNYPFTAKNNIFSAKHNVFRQQTTLPTLCQRVIQETINDSSNNNTRDYNNNFLINNSNANNNPLINNTKISKISVNNNTVNSNKIGNYRLLRTLGKGTYAKVKLAEHFPTGKEVAIKIIDKQRTRSSDLEKIYREIKIHKSLKHPNIVQLYEVIETSNHIYIVLEHAKRGEIFDYIVSKRRLTENDTRIKFRQLLSAVGYCHQNKIVHRDLKVENLLLDADYNIKICDFGFCNYFDTSNYLDTFCGSPPYAAPELFKGEKYIGPEVDVWSLGVILFTFLTGSLPFDGKTLPDLKNKVLQGTFKTPVYVSVRSELFLRKFLKKNPNDRLSLQQALLDDWTNLGFNCTPVYNPMNTKPIVNQIVLDKMISMGLAGDEIIDSIENKKFDGLHGIYNIFCKFCNNETEFVRSNHRGSTRSNIEYPTNSAPLNMATQWDDRINKKCMNPPQMKQIKPQTEELHHKNSFSSPRPSVNQTGDTNNNFNHVNENFHSMSPALGQPNLRNIQGSKQDVSTSCQNETTKSSSSALTLKKSGSFRGNEKVSPQTNYKATSTIGRSNSINSGCPVAPNNQIMYKYSNDYSPKITRKRNQIRTIVPQKSPPPTQPAQKCFPVQRNPSFKNSPIVTNGPKLQRLPTTNGPTSQDANYSPSLISHNPNVGMEQHRKSSLFKTSSKESVVSVSSNSKSVPVQVFRDVSLKKKFINLFRKH